MTTLTGTATGTKLRLELRLEETSALVDASAGGPSDPGRVLLGDSRSQRTRGEKNRKVPLEGPEIASVPAQLQGGPQRA